MTDSPNQWKNEDWPDKDESRADYQKRLDKLPGLIVTRNGVPVEDQVAGLKEFKKACIFTGRHTEIMERLFTGSRGGGKTADAQEALIDLKPGYEAYVRNVIAHQDSSFDFVPQLKDVEIPDGSNRIDTPEPLSDEELLEKVREIVAKYEDNSNSAYNLVDELRKAGL